MNDNQFYNLSVISDDSASVINSLDNNQLKIIMVGEASVGKSSLLDRYTRGQFFEQMSPSVGKKIKERVSLKAVIF